MPSIAPPNALRMWTDTRSILVELSGPGPDQFTILSYPRNSLGLSKALALISPPLDFAGATYVIPRAKRSAGTFAQQSLAEKLLRERGIIK